MSWTEANMDKDKKKTTTQLNNKFSPIWRTLCFFFFIVIVSVCSVGLQASTQVLTQHSAARFL